MVDATLELERITILTPDGGPERRVVISSIRVESAAAPEAQLMWQLETGHVVPYVTPERETVPLLIVNPTGTRIGGELALRLERADKTPVAAHRLPLALAPRSRQSLSIPVPPAGWYLLRASLSSGGTSFELPVRSLAVMEPAGPSMGPTAGFHFATCGGVPNNPDPDTLRRMLEAQSLIGIDVVRHDLHWDAVNPAQGRWNEDRLAWWEEAAITAKRYGIEHQVILCYNARWSAPAETRDDIHKWQKLAPVLEHWLPYVETTVRRLAPHVRYYEVWNEPDIIQFWDGSYEQYSELLAATHRTIKAIDPELQVLSGGFALSGGHGGKRDPRFQEKVMANDHAHFDILAHHQHGHFHHHAAKVDGILMPLMRKLPTDKRLWFNETATNRNDDRMHEQATTLTRKLAFTWSRGSMGYTWYNFTSGDLTSSTGHNWGLLTSDGQTCAAYVAYNTAVRHLRGLDFQQQLDLGQAERYGFSFADDQRSAVLLWDESADLAQQLLLFALPAGSAARPRLIDVYGHEQALPVHAGHVVVASGRDPAYVVADGELRYVGTLLGQSDVLPVAVPGRSHSLPLAISDPLAQGLELQLTWPAEVAGPSAQRVGAGTRAQALEADFRTPLALAVPAGQHHPLRLAWGVAGAPWAGELVIPLRVATRVPETGTDARAPDLTVEHERCVRDHYQYVPGTEHRSWQGPADCSFSAWFARDDETFELRVAARDDIHLPAAEGLAKGSDGDQLEVLLAYPGQNGIWRFNLLLDANGQAQVACIGSPGGLASDPAAIAVAAEAVEGGVDYRLRLSIAALGLGSASLEQPFGVNLVLRDRDLPEGRAEGWIQLAPQEFHWTPTGNRALFQQVVFAGE